jgi:Tol biopolymer transport system component
MTPLLCLPARPSRGWARRPYVVGADASSGPERRIADEFGDEYRPGWSPDGHRIAFLRRDAAGALSVVVASADGTGSRIVAANAAPFAPQWSPDGQSIAIVDASAAPAGLIRIVSVDSGASLAVLPTSIAGTPRGMLGVDAIGWQRRAP